MKPLGSIANTSACSATSLSSTAYEASSRLDAKIPPRFFAVLAMCLILAVPFSASAQSRRNSDEQQLERIPFDGKQAFEYLVKICDIGPRVSGTEGMKKQQEFLKKHFEELGGKVEFQSFQLPHPITRENTTISNLIVRWHPDRKERILICCHYDTRPFPDMDPRNPHGKFIGANDGASGAALLCELGKHMDKVPEKYGVDFVFFDAEEFVFDRRRDPMFIGSQHFSEVYAYRDRDYVYRAGILVDMIGDKSLELYVEANSNMYARDLTRSIWNTAKRLRVTDFVERIRHELRDDHLPLNEIAKIPTCDIIDFDYPSPSSRFSYWHTEADTPDKCSALSLAKVGWVLVEWLSNLE